MYLISIQDCETFLIYNSNTPETEKSYHPVVIKSRPNTAALLRLLKY